MTHQTVSLGKYWKLFSATLKNIRRVVKSMFIMNANP